MDIPTAANVLGTLGAVCWSIQLIPQIVINYRRHHATGLQPSMMMLWAWAGVTLGVYNIVSDFNVALRIQPQILTVLSLVTWAQCHYYQRRWNIARCFLAAVPVAVLMAGSQTGLIIGLGILKERRVEWPMTLMAILSAVLLAAGVLRHYWDIWVHRTVRGISFTFVGIDTAGDVFSLLSILFQPRLDVLGIAIYATEFVLWCGIFMCGGYYNLRPWVERRAAEPQDVAEDQPASDRGYAPANIITLHDVPSSTSVFRTASSEQRGGVRLRSTTTPQNQPWKGVDQQVAAGSSSI